MIIVASKCGRKTFHYPKCKYAKRINKENLIIFESKDDARAQGYKHCAFCSRLLMYYKRDKKNIDRFISTHFLKMYIEDDAMYIDNLFSSWKITTEPRSFNLVLYHANTESYNKLKIKNGHLIHHYHRQNYHGKSNIIDILQYIIDHDEWKAKNLDSYKTLPKRTKRQKKAYRKAKRKSDKTRRRNLYNLIDKVALENKKKTE